MKRYAPFRFRPVFALAAVGLAAATLSLTVAVPAALSSEAHDASVLAARPAAPAAIEVVIVPASIEVVGLRDANIVSTPERETLRRASYRS